MRYLPTRRCCRRHGLGPTWRAGRTALCQPMPLLSCTPLHVQRCRPVLPFQRLAYRPAVPCPSCLFAPFMWLHWPPLCATLSLQARPAILVVALALHRTALLCPRLHSLCLAAAKQACHAKAQARPALPLPTNVASPCLTNEEWSPRDCFPTCSFEGAAPLPNTPSAAMDAFCSTIVPPILPQGASAPRRRPGCPPPSRFILLLVKLLYRMQHWYLKAWRDGPACSGRRVLDHA